MAINRKNVAAPVVPKEAVQVDALGGEVVVRGLRLTERLAMDQQVAQSKREGGDSLKVLVPFMLAATVVDDEGQPLFSAEQWEDFGAKEHLAALELFNVAMRLSGYSGDEDRKNS